MDGVAALPGPGRVRGDPVELDDHPHRPLAAALDPGVGRLAQHGEATGQVLGVFTADPAKTVEALVDLLVVVEDPGDVAPRGVQRRGGRELDGQAAFHVAGAPSPDEVAATGGGDPRRRVARDRDGVQVAGDHHPLRPVEVGARDDDVAVADHLQVRVRAQRDLHRIGDRLLVAAHRLQVDQRPEQRDGIALGVQHHSRTRPLTRPRRRTRRGVRTERSARIRRSWHERHPTASVGSPP